ncbi:hypothetical protein M758_4G229700 [Ceratodon purpureus]|nr:hypothetical protein M758_4G229700 [Ceratodon purpureus]
MECLKLSIASVSSVMNSTPEDGPKVQVFTVCAVLVAMVVLPWLLIDLQRREPKLPPSPQGAWPIVGHLPLLGKNPHIAMKNWANQLGDMFLLRLGSVPAIVITSPEMAREVLLTQDKTWASRPKRKISAMYFSYNYRGITFAQYNATWRYLRKIVMLELLTTKRLEASLPIRKEEMLQMIWSIVQDAKLGKPVDVRLRLNNKMANEIFRMVLGCRFSGSKQGDVQGDDDIKGREFQDIIDENQQLKGLFLLGDYVPWLRFLDIGGIEKRIKVCQGRLDRFLNKVVDEHEANRRKGPIAETDKDMVDVLLRTMHEQDQKETLKLDVSTIKATVMSMIAAGVDTSSITVEWGMAELIRHPDTMQKLTEELDSVVGKTRMVQETDIPNLKYLQAVVKEVLRLHPPAPLLIPHVSTQDCEIAGYHIPADTRLYVHAHAIGRNAKAWDSPLDFDPERFISRPEIDLRGHDFGLLPFGSGRRACPAITMGTLQVQWTMATLVHSFAWSLPTGQCFEDLDMEEEFGITTPRANALTLHAAPRLIDTDLYQPCC